MVATVINERITSASATCIDFGAEIDPANMPDVSWLLADELGNLADNALIYTPAGGCVTVRCGYDPAPFMLVSDTGSGIRGGNARGDGSGQGLAIVQEVAQLHGARLSIDAATGAEGTIVTHRFPDPGAGTAI